jgi:MFS family permease
LLFNGEKTEQKMKLSRLHLVRVFIPFALGYFLSYLYRTVNAVLSLDLVVDLGLDPSALGLLTATYFITFAAFQLPLGVLLDRFGPRRIEALLLIFAGAGAFCFAKADSLSGLLVGRALIGLGVSACLMAAFKAFAMWFPKEQLPLVNGIQMGAGGLGALTATAPVEAALQFTDWRGVFMVLSVLTLAVVAAVFFVVPERKTEGAGASLREEVRGILRVYTSPLFWRIAPLTVMSHATFLSIQGLWAGPWLRDVAGFDRTTMASVLLLIALAMAAGFILLGAIAERLSRHGIRPLTFAVFGMSAFMFVQALIVLEWTALTLPLWILFGFLGTTGAICYAVLSQSFPLHLVGRANTGLNVLVFVAAFSAQWGIGAVINLWPTATDGGYLPPAYQAGFGVMLGLQVLGLIWFIVAGIKWRSEET